MDYEDRAILDDDDNISSAARQKQQHDEEIADMRWLLSTPVGVRIMARLMDKGKVFDTTFTNNGYTAFNEGARAFVLANILDYVLEADPSKFEAIVLRVRELGGK